MTTQIPCYPDFAPLDISHKNALHPRLSLTHDGVSEFTFAGLFLFRDRYNYKISRNGEEGGFIISGKQPFGNECNLTFFMTPCGAPDIKTLESLFASHDYWKNISETVLSQCSVMEKTQDNSLTAEKYFLWQDLGIVIEEDRKNFDYLYYRNDLAELTGKKFHKKKNHVNNFLHSYPDHEQMPMNKTLIPAAIEVLDRWRHDMLLRTGEEEGDYKAAIDAIEMFDSLPLKGSVFYISGKPVAYCLGESISRGRMFVIHFEKAIEEYRGVYQYVNKAFAASLPRFFTLINREQDLGNEGLRQAKMTYRPCDFVRKYTGRKIN